MSRTVVTETTVYTFDELSDSAKETAREEWSRFLWDDGSMQEDIESIWQDKLTDAGWTNLSNLEYALYMQGGYPTWNGTLRGFQHGGKTWTITTVNGRGRSGTSVEAEDDADEDVSYGTPEWNAWVEAAESAEKAARDHVYNLSHELYQAFEAEDEHQASEESVREAAEANGYEYDKTGHLA